MNVEYQWNRIEIEQGSLLEANASLVACIVIHSMR